MMATVIIFLSIFAGLFVINAYMDSDPRIICEIFSLTCVITFFIKIVMMTYQLVF